MSTDTGDTTVLGADESWETVLRTMHGARSALYTAGSTAILLMWGGIISVAYLAQYAVGALAMVSPDGAGSGAVELDEVIHQQTRLQIMSLLVSVDDGNRLAYGFVQAQLGLTPGNLTTHLRKLEDAAYVTISKEFHGAKPRTWLEATAAGRKAFAEYLQRLEQALSAHRRS